MKYYLVIIIALLFNSCAFVPSINNTSYIIDSKTNNFSINTKEGKWLLCEANISPQIYKEVISEIKNVLTPKLNDRLFFHYDNGVLIPNPLRFEVNEDILIDIKNANDFDYLIVLDVNINQNNFSDYSLIPAIDKNAQKKATSRINVYDLNTKKLIYNKEVKGIISVAGNDNELRPVYSKNINKLNLKTFRKFLKTFSNDLESF